MVRKKKQSTRRQSEPFFTEGVSKEKVYKVTKHLATNRYKNIATYDELNTALLTPPLKWSSFKICVLVDFQWTSTATVFATPTFYLSIRLRNLPSELLGIVRAKGNFRW